MSIRKITSTTLMVSFIVLLFNSVVLYVVPEGRVAYWADWRFLGLGKSQWGDQHVTVGVLFLLAGLLHLYYNWRTIVAYLKNKARRVSMFSGPFASAVALTALFVAGTYFEVPPFSTVVGISASIKDAAARTYGEPPYGHAELSSLRSFADKQHLDLAKSLELLVAAGITVVGENETIRDIADKNGMTPQQVYEKIGTAVADEQRTGLETASRFPEEPEPGWGNLTLAEVCSRYGLDQHLLVTGLRASGMKVEAGMTMKELAAINDREPKQLFEQLQNLVTAASPRGQ